MREEAEGSFESNVQSTWLAGLWEMYSRAPQINQKTEFWYFTLTTRSYMKDGPQEQASANTQMPYLGVFGLFEHVFQRAKYG